MLEAVRIRPVLRSELGYLLASIRDVHSCATALLLALLLAGRTV